MENVLASTKAQPPPTPRGLASQIPNALSAMRILMAVAYPFAPQPVPGTFGWRAGIVITSALTDGLDGVLARKMHWTSTLGGLLDAIADKLFILVVLGTFAADAALPWWQVLLLLARDFAVGFVAAYAALQGRWSSFARMRPRPLGKATTFAHFALMLTVLLWRDGIGIIVWLVIGTSALAATDYFARFLAELRKNGAS